MQDGEGQEENFEPEQVAILQARVVVSNVGDGEYNACHFLCRGETPG